MDEVWVPEVPVTVTVFVPRLAVLLAVKVNVAFPVVGLGEKDAETPLGRPETARLTLPVNPYSGFTPMKVVLEVPWPMVTPPEFESVKVGA